MLVAEDDDICDVARDNGAQQPFETLRSRNFCEGTCRLKNRIKAVQLLAGDAQADFVHNVLHFLLVSKAANISEAQQMHTISKTFTSSVCVTKQYILAASSTAAHREH